MRTIRTLIYTATGIAIVGAAIHVGAVFGGPSWYAFFGAPPSVVASARAGTWWAPTGALIIAALMAACAIYSASALELVRPPPLQRSALASIALIALVRALVLIPLALRDPRLWTPFQVIAAIVWGVAGIGFAAAFVHRLARSSAAPSDRR